ncbi:hypothetical protein EXE10_16005 [Acinetobacter sp. WCHAc060033]|uniref:hypothetical protein n=1 Tax=Acinetobacter sp. WCHAc060033 TaxID=2518624 RepID=UPI00102315B1|nr:hypothetical protein [Acinetobacter sp. WCHAc060033]RZG79234.1 hypothetical protein EXE10_16005 [Acinetobacter sp. WCHAc060033]
MLYKKTNPTMIMFGTLLIALCSAISTTIFSESAFNDHFGFGLMAIAIIGLCLNISYMFINMIFRICNP